jgi:hypothetical protein
MSLLRCKVGIDIGHPSPAGFQILTALNGLAQSCTDDVVITSGMEDRGRALDDTHMLGEAYDISVSGVEADEVVRRYQWLSQVLGRKFLILYEVPPSVLDSLPQPLKDIAYVNAGATAVHMHIALRHGQSFP